MKAERDAALTSPFSEPYFLPTMLLKTINYWSFPGGLEGSLDPFEALELAKQYRFEAIELCPGDGAAFGLDADEKFCRSLRERADQLGLRLPSVGAGTYWSRNLASADAGDREAARHDLARLIRITSWLGAKTLLTIPGAVDVFFLPDRPVQPYKDVLRYAKEGLAALLPLAEQCKVRLGIENVWNKFLLSPHETVEFIDSFGSPWIGSYFDVGNVLPFGYPEDWLRTLGKRVVGIHFKDFRRAVGTADGFVDLLEGDVNWPKVMKAIRDIGYEGGIAAEMIPGYRHHPIVRIANTSNALDAILEK